MGPTSERGMLGAAGHQPMERLMSKPKDLSRSLIAFEQNSTLVAVIEMSLSSWLVAGIRGIADGIVLSWLAIWILPKGWVAAYGGWDGRVSGLLFGS